MPVERITMATSPELNGFTSDVRIYFAELATNNSKVFFDENRGRYEHLVKQPLELFLAAAEPIYGPGKVLRPNRDVRFSANKDPYRTDAAMMAGTIAGVYLNLNAERIEVGGGLYGPSRDQLDRARTLLSQRPAVAGELDAILTQLETAGFDVAGPSLKTAPKGFDPAHPAIRLLRLQHYAALRRLPIDVDPTEVLESWSRISPLNAWVDKHVGPALSRR